MADRHHYGPQGEYLGHSSDTPPLAKLLGGIVLVVVVLFVLSSLESTPGGNGLPRPSDQGFVGWVTGEHVVLSGQDLWRIDPGEVSDLRVVRVDRDAGGDTYTATLRFKVFDAVKRNGGNVEGRVRYRKQGADDRLFFVNFTADSFDRTGNW